MYLNSEPGFEYARQECERILQQVKRKLQSLKGLRAQSFLLMLRLSVVPSLMFMLQTVDPRITIPIAERMDSEIEQVLVDLVLQNDTEEYLVDADDEGYAIPEQYHGHGRIVRAVIGCIFRSAWAVWVYRAWWISR